MQSLARVSLFGVSAGVIGLCFVVLLEVFLVLGKL